MKGKEKYLAVNHVGLADSFIFVQGWRREYLLDMPQAPDRVRRASMQAPVPLQIVCHEVCDRRKVQSLWAFIYGIEAWLKLGLQVTAADLVVGRRARVYSFPPAERCGQEVPSQDNFFVVCFRLAARLDSELFGILKRCFLLYKLVRKMPRQIYSFGYKYISFRD